MEADSEIVHEGSAYFDKVDTHGLKENDKNSIR
jgi:hypothetical protein